MAGCAYVMFVPDLLIGGNVLLSEGFSAMHVRAIIGFLNPKPSKKRQLDGSKREASNVGKYYLQTQDSYQGTKRRRS